MGKVHWLGDGDVTEAGGTLFIVLKRDRWSVVAQKVADENSALELKVTYSLSLSCSLGRRPAAMPLTAPALQGITGLHNAIPALSLSDRATWLALMLGPGRVVEQAPVGLNPAESEARTFTTIFPARGKDLIDRTLCLAFPPGKGMVTVANVQLLREQAVKP